MKLFYECNFFNCEPVVKNKFVVKQNELLLKEILPSGKSSFNKMEVEYRCLWQKQADWLSNKPAILIPIRNNPKLISVTISNLLEHNLDKHCNIIIIDDRSEEDIRSLVVQAGLSYLRVDNSKGFNFSMLNNIAAKLCYDMGVETIILWNSDLWCVKEEWFLDLLDRHYKENSVLSGTKLVYPPIEYSLNKEEDSENIRKYFPHMLNGKWRNTVQFGSGGWIYASEHNRINCSPIHYGRFFSITDARVNCDKGTDFVTGALSIIDLERFISFGGLNPSLSKNFQDVDLSLRLLENKDNLFYFGKNIFFYHDESFNLENNKSEKKNDQQFKSDHVLFSKMWGAKIPTIVA
jgi:GT2 family glycosyltransferase